MQYVVQPCITKSRWGGDTPGRYFGDVDEPMFTLTTQDNKGVVTRDVRACITPDRINKRQRGRRFKECDEPMFTLTAQDIQGILERDGERYDVRRLTPLEYDRLQGFPDNWTQFGDFPEGTREISKSRRYALVGNSVTIPVMTAIGKEIRKEIA